MSIIRRNERAGLPVRTDWDPFRLVDQVLRWDPLRAFDPFHQMTAFAPDERTFLPRFDVKETKEGYQFKADLPGLTESDIEISLTGNQLTVSGKRETESHEDNDTFYACERQFGSFSRVFTLPEACDAEHVRAEMNKGVLTIALPKKPELQPRKIAIKPSTPAQ